MKKGIYFVPEGIRWMDEHELEQYRTKPYFSICSINLSHWFWVVCQSERPIAYGFEETRERAEMQGRHHAGACVAAEAPQYIRRKVPAMPHWPLTAGWCYLYYPLSRDELALVTQTRPQAVARECYRRVFMSHTDRQHTRKQGPRRRKIPSPSSASTPTCFAILEVPAASTEDEIKRAYRHKCFVNHPDYGGTHEAFLRLQHAYQEALFVARMTLR